MTLHEQFVDAAKAGDYAHIIRLAKENGLTRDLSTTTNIGERTLRGMYNGNITPSKNQQNKIRDFVRTLTA